MTTFNFNQERKIIETIVVNNGYQPYAYIHEK